MSDTPNTEIAPYRDLSPSEWDRMQEQAKILASSNLVPRALRGKPADVLLVALAGRELGLGPTTAMSHIHVIEGKPTLSAESMVALARRAGHSISGESTPERAVAKGKRGDTGDEMTVEWTMQMAQRAGVTNKSNWKNYPEAMLWARAVSQLCRMLFPDVLMGCSYVPEELGDDGDVALSAEVTAAPQKPASSPDSDEVVDAEIVDDGPRPVTGKTWQQALAITVAQWCDDNGGEVDADELRYALVAYATNGDKEKSSECSDEDRPALLEAWKALAAGRLAVQTDERGSVTLVEQGEAA